MVFIFLNNGSDTEQFITDPFELLVSNSNVPSPPSAKGTEIIEMKDRV